MPTVSDSGQMPRRAVRDLVALTALPAMWVGYDQRQIAETLADALRNILRVDFIYVRECGPPKGEKWELLRGLDERAKDGQITDFRGALLAQLGDLAGVGVHPIVDPQKGETFNVAIASVSCDGEEGLLAAGARRTDFPSEEDRLILSVAANQMAIVLQRRSAEEAQRRACGDAA